MKRSNPPQRTSPLLGNLGFDEQKSFGKGALKVNELIGYRSLSPMEIAAITGISQPIVSKYAATSSETFT